ncbi:MAG: PAS domain S-box-containing protein [Candidatus Nitrotoga sp. MKT]|nr:MAG: PAS domain S-box-containing protein [Candidatus Nitrotoga sp. MKT]
MFGRPDILNASLLIVDDQEANIHLLEALLRGAGYTRITSTQNPYEVCELYRKNRYALIILDLQMPGMDGFQVLEGLKKIETDGYLPVLVVTAQPDHKLRALQAGAKDFISKPFDLTEVQIRIHNMLEVRLLYKQIENHNKILEQTVEARTAELRESEARFRRLTELSSDWHWEQDETGHFTHVYGVVLDMLGIEVDDLLSEPGETQAASWNKDERAMLVEYIAARRPFLDFVYRRHNLDGSQQCFMISGEPMFDSSGRFTGYRGVGKDVTGSIRTVS